MDVYSLPTPVGRFCAVRLLAVTACSLSFVGIAPVGPAIGATGAQSGQPGAAVAPPEGDRCEPTTS